MARPLRIEYLGALYHVTSHGNEQKNVFKSYKDREKFLSYMESAGVRYGAVVHTWCLMSNHYHLLLETPSGNLSQIMKHIKAELGDRAELLRNVSLYCCQKYSGAKLKDIGECFGISDAAVSQASREVALKAEIDPQLKKILDRVEPLLRNVKS